MEYGGFGVRLVAYIIDGIIVTVLFFLFYFILNAIGFIDYSAIMELANDPATQAGGEPDPVLAMAAAQEMMRQMGVLYLGGLLIAWLYEALMVSSSMQATPGKMVFGLRVTTVDGGPVGFGRATGRFFGKIISQIILYVGFIMVAFSSRKQGLHDMIANTLVVRA
ncbi:MAG: RDD family protein [Dongiaceae bacterium]